MRDVPLGLAVGGTTLGMVLGGVAALVSNSPGSLCLRRPPGSPWRRWPFESMRGADVNFAERGATRG
jgi:hypothetical protein